MPVFESHSEEETQKIAADLATRAAPGDVYTLQGTLGAGKSVFARAFILSLLEEQTDIPSPTFTLVQTYESRRGALWHFDLYRLEDPEEIFELGWEEAIAGGITLVEWPERLGHYWPKSAKTIHIDTGGNTQRTITIDE